VNKIGMFLVSETQAQKKGPF